MSLSVVVNRSQYPELKRPVTVNINPPAKVKLQLKSPCATPAVRALIV